MWDKGVCENQLNACDVLDDNSEFGLMFDPQEWAGLRRRPGAGRLWVARQGEWAGEGADM